MPPPFNNSASSFSDAQYSIQLETSSVCGSRSLRLSCPHRRMVAYHGCSAAANVTSLVTTAAGPERGEGAPAKGVRGSRAPGVNNEADEAARNSRRVVMAVTPRKKGDSGVRRNASQKSTKRNGGNWAPRFH